jgi:hypothetical protein
VISLFLDLASTCRKNDESRKFFFLKKKPLISHKDDCKVYYLSLAGNALAVSRKA